jgi:hypothetical protein
MEFDFVLRASENNPHDIIVEKKKEDLRRTRDSRTVDAKDFNIFMYPRGVTISDHDGLSSREKGVISQTIDVKMLAFLRPRVA